MTNRTIDSGFSVVGISLIVFTLLLAVLIGWGTYRTLIKKTTIPPGSTSAGSAKTQQSLFRLPELGAGFFPKASITPVYRIADTTTTSGVTFKTIFVSTDQLIEKEKSLSPGKSTSLCGAADTENGILQMRAYRSKEDLLRVEDGNLPFNKITLPDIKPENGFIDIGDTTYHIPSGIEAGQGPCIDDASFYSQQWKLLHDSLLTLQPL